MSAISVTRENVTSNRLRSSAVCDFHPSLIRAQHKLKLVVSDKALPVPPPSVTGN